MSLGLEQQLAACAYGLRVQGFMAEATLMRDALHEIERLEVEALRDRYHHQAQVATLTQRLREAEARLAAQAAGETAPDPVGVARVPAADAGRPAGAI